MYISFLKLLDYSLCIKKLENLKKIDIFLFFINQDSKKR